MKKLFAIVLALVLSLSLLSISAFAADDYWCIAGTMNDWNSNSSDRMTDNGDGTYTYTFADMAAGSYEFKFTKNGTWDYNLGGAFMGSGVESSLSQNGSNIKFTLEETNDVTIVLDATNKKFTMTIGGHIAEEPENITIHVSVPEDWGTAYAYCWNPESLGTWPGTAVTDGAVTLPAVFDGFIVNNNNGRQTSDITDIDLTKSEVWVTVHADNTYSLSYEAPSGNEPEPEVSYIKIHVIAPESWENAYAYAYNPEQCGTWPGTLVADGYVEVIASFEGFIVNNGAGAQTADIKDIDLTAEEVWVVVAEDCSYALYYNEADVVIPEPPATIKINVIAEHWTSVYAYTYNPASCGNWPGVLVENGFFEVQASFEGLVLNNGEGQQTPDITDIDLTQAEVWVVVNADNTYTLSYEAPVVEEPTPDPVVPTIEDGRYVISWGELTFAALAEDKTYGYNPAGDLNNLTDADYVTITNVDGGFIIQDCYGRYVYMTGNYNSVNLSTELPAEGHIWTLVEAEGGVMVMNVLKEKYLAYSEQYSSWGVYSSISETSVLTITAEVVEEPKPPVTGDAIFAVLSILAVSGMGITAVASKKRG